MKLIRLSASGLLIFLFSGFSAQVNLDSLNFIWKDSNNSQSNRLSAVEALIMNLKSTRADSAIVLANEMFDYANLFKNYKAIAKALNLKGISLAILNRNTEALQAYKNAFKTYNNIKDTSGIITVNNNIGILYNKSDNIAKALKIYYKNQSLSQITYDTLGWIASNINISFLIEDNDYDSSKILIKQAYNLCKKIKNENESFAFVNYILAYYKLRDSEDFVLKNDDVNFYKTLDSAEYYLEVSYDNYKSNGDLQGMAFYYEGLAEINYVRGDIKTTLNYIDKALNLVKKIKGKGIPGNSKGLLFYWIPFEISTSQTSSLYYFKYYVYSQINEHEKALSFFEKYHQLKDSVDKTSAKEGLMKYEFQAKRQIDSLAYLNEIKLQQAEAKAKDEEIKAQRRLEFGMLVIIILIVGFLYFVFRQLKTTKAQKIVIEHKQKEISDSINYAKRIQDAMMTSSINIKEIINEYFIFFKPKDVVSGDFYWVHQNQEGDIFFTVADCTGHGVPGAFMSMIGTSLLNEIIVEKKISNTDEILFLLRSQIIKALNQNDVESQKDGMDISLCRLNIKKREIQFSGALNPMIYVSGDKLTMIKGDPQPIGYSGGINKAFTVNNVKLKKDDMIYIFSDGFQDQFGGPKGKKYRSLRFRNLLKKISLEHVDKQKIALENEFNTWKVDQEQIDDVCVMGVRIT